MKKKWTESSARRAVGGEVKHNTLFISGCLSGLSACSALDYLKSKCNYRVVFVKGA